MHPFRWCGACSEELPLDESRRTYTRSEAFCKTCGDPYAVAIEAEVHDDGECAPLPPNLQAARWTLVSPVGEERSPSALWSLAMTWAVERSLASGRSVVVDVLCSSRAAAHVMGLLEEHDADPDASVTSRVVIRTEHVGRVA